MEFNTASIWGIIIFLILVTIFIVIWYGYKEIIYCKRRIEDLSSSKEEDQDEQFEAFFEEPEVFDEDLDEEQEESQGEYQELFEPEELSQSQVETLQQETELQPQEEQQLRILETIREEPEGPEGPEEQPVKPKKRVRNNKKFSIEQV